MRFSNPRTKVLLQFDKRVCRNAYRPKSIRYIFGIFFIQFQHKWTEISIKIFWSPVVRQCLCLSVCSSPCKLFTSLSSLESLGQFQPNSAQKSLDDRDWIFFQMKHHALFDGEITKYQNALTNWKIVLFRSTMRI